MTKFTTEISKAWEVLTKNFFSMLVIISLLFLVGRVEFLPIYNIYFDLIYKLFHFLITVFLSLMVVHIVIISNKGEKLNIIEIVGRIISESKEVVIIICLQILFLFLTIFIIIPVLPALIIQTLFIFVWQVYILEDKRRFEALVESTKVVANNALDVFKYILVYFLITLLISLPLLAEGLEMRSFEKIILIGLNYFRQFLVIFYTVLTTNLYLLYSNKDNKLI